MSADVFEFAKKPGDVGGDVKEGGGEGDVKKGGGGQIVAVNSDKPVEENPVKKSIGTPIDGAEIVTDTSDPNKKYYMVVDDKVFEYNNNSKGLEVTGDLALNLIATVAALSSQAGGRRRSRRNRRQNGKRQSKKRQQNRQSKKQKQNGGKKRRNSKRNQKK